MKIFIISLFVLSMVNLTVLISPAEANEEEIKELKFEENSCIGLNYHRVRDFGLLDSVFRFFSNSNEMSTYSVSEASFREQMEWLTEHNAVFLTMNEMLTFYKRGTFPQRCVWLNFDDMDQTIYDNVHPILKEMNIPATGFVITGEIGNSNFNNLDLINQHELNEMSDSGIWEFESHTDTLHHLIDNQSLLLVKDEHQMQADMLTSLHYLNSNFGCSCNVLAYPYGQSNDTLVSVLEDTGIDFGFTLEDKAITAGSHPYYLPRVLISEDSFETLIKNWEGFE